MAAAAEKKPPKARPLSKEQLAKEADVQLRSNTRETLRKYWDGVGKALDRGEKWAFELMARTYNYDKAPGGLTIYNNHLQVNGAAANSVDASVRLRSFDQIVGKLEDKSSQKARLMLAQPAEEEDDEGESGEDGEDNVMDGEFEEITDSDINAIESIAAAEEPGKPEFRKDSNELGV